MSEVQERVGKTLDVRTFFNPVDCRSLGVIKVALSDLESGAVLEILANRFQQREIHAWLKKFAHRLLHEEDRQGLVKLYIERGER